MRCRRYRREGCVRRVWCVRCVRCQWRVVLLTAVTTGAPHLEVRTCLVTVIPRFLLYHHPCTEKDIAPTDVGSISSRLDRQQLSNFESTFRSSSIFALESFAVSRSFAFPSFFVYLADRKENIVFEKEHGRSRIMANRRGSGSFFERVRFSRSAFFPRSSRSHVFPLLSNIFNIDLDGKTWRYFSTSLSLQVYFYVATQLSANAEPYLAGSNKMPLHAVPNSSLEIRILPRTNLRDLGACTFHGRVSLTFVQIF